MAAEVEVEVREARGHLTILIGQPAAGTSLRRRLTLRSYRPGAGSARSLRRMLMIRGGEPIVLCIDLSSPNVRRHRRLLATLAAGSSGAVRTVGLLGRDGLTRRCAEVGCDLYVTDGEDAVDLVRTLHGNPSRETAVRGRGSGVAARLGGCVRTVEIPADPAGPVTAN